MIIKCYADVLLILKFLREDFKVFQKIQQNFQEKINWKFYSNTNHVCIALKYLNFATKNILIELKLNFI